MKRVQLWSCGGGRQSMGIGALIAKDLMPRPDHIVMTALRGEKRSTWDQVCGYLRPAMWKLGIPFTIVPSVKWTNIGLFSGADGDSPVMPMHTNQSGQASKLSEFCSGEWKREVALRWAATVHPEWKTQGVDNWVGISADEGNRRRAPRRQWFQPVYPLLDWFPKLMTVATCIDHAESLGWPVARSRCVYCPNQSDAEWMELTPEELEKAARCEDEIRKVDPHAWLHRSMKPLRQVKFVADNNLRFTGGCSSGTCY